MNRGYLRAIVAILFVLILFSCSDEKDMREGVIDAYGEPDVIDEGGSGAYKWMLYVYLHKDINRVYEFRKSAPGCGGEGQWYVENVYYSDYHFNYELYQPPVIQHSPVVTAPSGKPVTITAIITDDEQVLTADLFYKAVGTQDSVAVEMTVSESVYSAVIPAEVVTQTGVMYFIESSDGEHTSQMPPDGFFTITVTSGEAESAKVYADPVTSSPKNLPSDITAPNDAFDRQSPVSP